MLILFSNLELLLKTLKNIFELDGHAHFFDTPIFHLGGDIK